MDPCASFPSSRSASDAMDGEERSTLDMRKAGVAGRWESEVARLLGYLVGSWKIVCYQHSER